VNPTKGILKHVHEGGLGAETFVGTVVREDEVIHDRILIGCRIEEK
jgi:hypothetical protein